MCDTNVSYVQGKMPKITAKYHDRQFPDVLHKTHVESTCNSKTAVRTAADVSMFFIL